MMKPTWVQKVRRMAPWLIAVAVAAIGISACGSSSKEAAPSEESGNASESAEANSSEGGAPEGKGETIAVGNIASLANIGGVFAAYQAGVQAYFEYMNAKGGINGYKINFVHMDDEGNPSKAAQAARTLAAEDKVVAIVGEASLADAATQKYLEAQKVPVIGGWATSSAWHKPSTNMFVNLEGPNMPYCVAWSNPTAASMGVKTMAFIAQEFPAAVQDAECREAGAKYAGIEPVGKIIQVSLTAADYRPAVQQAMATGADAIYFSTGTDGIIKGIEAGEQLGFKGIYVATQPAGLLKPLAPLASKLNGRVITTSFSLLPSDPTSESPELEAWKEGMEKYQSQYANEITSISGWAAGVMFGSALTEAGPEREALLEYMSKLTGYEFGGLQGEKSYTEGSKPNKCTLPLVMENDEWVRAPNAPEPPKFECTPLLSKEGKEIE